MNNYLQKYEYFIDIVLKQAIMPFARFSLFIVYFWFGALKLFNLSSANGLIDALLAKTMPFIPFDAFIIFLGFVEVMIGLLFIFPRLFKIMFGVMVVHMITTMLPLLLLPDMTWDSFLAPSLEGQYIIKNFVLISLAGMLALHTPVRKR